MKEKLEVMDLISGLATVSKNVSYKQFNADERNQISAALGKREFLTVPEAALWLQVSVETVYRMIRDGRIRAYSIPCNGCRYRVDVEKSKKLFNR